MGDTVRVTYGGQQLQADLVASVPSTTGPQPAASSQSVTPASNSAPFPTQPTNLNPTAGANLSGTVTTTSGGFSLGAVPGRRPGDVQGQNVGTVTIGFNEFGGTAVIGQAGTYTVPAGSTFSITTNNQVNFIAASGTCPVTITGLA